MATAVALVILSHCSTGEAATTIDAASRYAYGANVGWVNFAGDVSNGAVIGEYACSGYVYAANIGWINLGSGTPTNGIYYQNISANDFGVNQDGIGNLRGYAYGANIGWINFENTGAPKVDLKTGKFSGSIYSANCGWISLSNASAFVQTDTIAPGADADGDGIADAWELQYFGNLITANATSDFDHDGVSDLSEYLQGTDPRDASNYLRITGFSTASFGSPSTLTWTSVPTRLYHVIESTSLAVPNWYDSVFGLITSDGATTTRMVTDTNSPMRFFRVEALKPLSP